MKTLILLIATINLNLTMQYANADSTYCEWVGQAANIIAENRNNGMSEFDLMENYLDQNQSYHEQKVVIPLIERIYSTDRGIGPEEIAIVEQQQCEIAQLSNSEIKS